MRTALAALLMSCAGACPAQDIILTSPIDCDLGTTCFIQQYMDRDPSTRAQDHRCAGLSYDGHKGTDFALPSMAMMQAGVAVLAAADGIVVGVRDGMPDTGYTPETAAAIKGRECGNRVGIEHPNGWITQYCHLKEGSITVQNGQRIVAGDPLAEIGKSGNAAFPHLHLGVRKNGETIDPFAPDNTLSCNAPGKDTLWAKAPPYRPGGLIGLGFSDDVPAYDTIKDGTAHQNNLPASAPALVIWGYSFGTQTNDVLRLSINGPQGTLIAKDIEMEKPQAQSFRAIGKKRRTADWPAGIYIGTVSLIRNGTTIETRKTQLTLR